MTSLPLHVSLQFCLSSLLLPSPLLPLLPLPPPPLSPPLPAPVFSFVVVLGVVWCVAALYDSNDDVVELTESNFQRLVLQGDEVWMVEFYAPW